MAYRRTEGVIARLAARNEAIVAAARALAAEKGISAVQIVPVAERAGIASGTVYRYFPSKEDLVAALVGAIAEQEIAAIRSAVAAAPGPLSALAAAIMAVAARALRERRLAAAMLAGPAEGDAAAKRLAFRRALADELAARIGAAIKSGHLPDQDSLFAAASVIGAVVEGLVGELFEPKATVAARHDAAQALTLFVLRGLGVPDARARGLVAQAGCTAQGL
ncbi:MAG: TetR/AcrR family transcriptional regulator [Xanthobacteraceae bacterium]|nr:TetR/AcrR family transcriptional regulator [Xanthobacteraceae bacterium]